MDYLTRSRTITPTRPRCCSKAEPSRTASSTRRHGVCRALWSLGVRKGDRVALLLPNCPQFLIAEVGTWKIGAVVVAVNPTYTERELEGMLDATRAKTIITLTPFYERVKRVQGRVGLEHVIATSIKEYLPAVLRVLFTILKEKKEGHRIRLAAGDLWMADLIRAHGDSARPSVSVGLTTPLSSCRAVERLEHPKVSSDFTGTTPPGDMRKWTKSAKRPWVDVIMPLPLFHVYAQTWVFSRWPSSGEPARSCESSRHRRPAENDRHSQAGVFQRRADALHSDPQPSGVRAGKIDLSSIKLCFSGSAALMAETKRQFEEKPALASLRAGDRRHDGLLREPGAEEQDRIDWPAAARRRRPDRRRRDEVGDKPAGEVGELIMHSPQHMLEYWNNPLEAWRHFDVVTMTAECGCTPATWPTSMRTAMCSSSIARRTC